MSEYGYIRHKFIVNKGKLSVGSIVMLNPESKYYGYASIHNPKDIEGVVISIGSEHLPLGVSVTWHNGESNTYGPCDLDIIR